jgi:hypothetical protein
VNDQNARSFFFATTALARRQKLQIRSSTFFANSLLFRWPPLLCPRSGGANPIKCSSEKSRRRPTDTSRDRERRDQGISEADLQVAFGAEYLENEILPATDVTEDWLKLIDYDPDNVVKISPVRMLDRSKSKTTSGVI